MEEARQQPSSYPSAEQFNPPSNQDKTDGQIAQHALVPADESTLAALRAHNETLPISHLPNELLEKIFDICTQVWTDKYLDRFGYPFITNGYSSPMYVGDSVASRSATLPCGPRSPTYRNRGWSFASQDRLWRLDYL